MSQVPHGPADEQADDRSDGDQTRADSRGAGPPAVAVTDLELTYSDGTRAVDGVSLTIPRGECFGFLGANGAGKTTTIKVLATLLSPTGGTVEINGYDVTQQRTAVRGTIGYMAQSVSVDEELSARDNLAFACQAYGVDDRTARIDELLELVDLADVADTPAGNFSGGMQKRLDAAMALVHDPELVFLDEPTTGLDPAARERLWEYVERINERGTTVFLTTQYLAEADRLCDRLAVLRDGTVVAEGSPAELKRGVGGQTLEVTLAGGADAADRGARVARESHCLGPDDTVETTETGLAVTTPAASERGPELVVALREAGLAVTGFDIEDVTLDDVFFAIADGDETPFAEGSA